MNKGITGLAWGLSLLCTTASAADNINTPGDQQWLKQQENLSEQLRQHPDKRKRTARTVLTGMCYSVGSVMRQGS
ncbi:hypothetical protein AB7868_20115, partial [Klebsiella pneumoniae]